MPGEVVPLVTRRPVKTALDFLKVEAATDGTIFVTVTDGWGDPVELSFSEREAELLCGMLADARDVAKGMVKAWSASSFP